MNDYMVAYWVVFILAAVGFAIWGLSEYLRIKREADLEAFSKAEQKRQGDAYQQMVKEAQARSKLEWEAIEQAQQPVKDEYSKKYEERKITIGIIKCSQCEWSGEWGTGMSYEQFFAGDLAEHEIHVGRSKGEKSSLSLNNRQYECPVCNSLSWKKV